MKIMEIFIYCSKITAAKITKKTFRVLHQHTETY